MQNQEWVKTWHNSELDVQLLQASYIHHAYPRHSHDYYVICVIDRGHQTFTYRGAKHHTPPGGVILLNPGEAHTGEPADGLGFEMRSLYPTTAHMETALLELTGRHRGLPFFSKVRIDHRWALDHVSALHRALAGGAGALECESRFTWTLAQFVKRYADIRPDEPPAGRERTVVERARLYIEEHYDQGIRLAQLAEHVSLSPYYLLRVFRAEVGMPPYAYLESVRVRHAQRLIEAGEPLARIAADVGYSSQSHFTRRFKRIIGTTPGQYARQGRAATPPSA